MHCLLWPCSAALSAGLVHEGKLRCTQRGVTAHPLTTKGAIRFSAPAAEE
jgi:hypothetical protein